MSISVQISVQVENCPRGQNDGVTIARAHHTFCGDEMVRTSRVNRNPMRAAVQAVVKDGRVDSLLQRTASSADATDLLFSCSHIDPGA